MTPVHIRKTNGPSNLVESDKDINLDSYMYEKIWKKWCFIYMAWYGWLPHWTYNKGYTA